MSQGGSDKRVLAVPSAVSLFPVPRSAEVVGGLLVLYVEQCYCNRDFNLS